MLGGGRRRACRGAVSGLNAGEHRLEVRNGALDDHAGQVKRWIHRRELLRPLPECPGLDARHLAGAEVGLGFSVRLGDAPGASDRRTVLSVEAISHAQ